MALKINGVEVVLNTRAVQNLAGAEGDYSLLLPSVSTITSTVIDFSKPWEKLALTGNITFTESNKGEGKTKVLELDLSSSLHTPTFSSNVIWQEGASAPSWDNFRYWIITLFCVDSTVVRAVANGYDEQVSVPVINSVTPSVTTVNEGSSISFTVNTTNIPDGSVLGWAFTYPSSPSASDADIVTDGGNVTINSDTGTFSTTIENDFLTEGNEYFRAEVTGTVNSQAVSAESVDVLINDTSQTPTITATEAASSMNEGTSLTINVSTANISDGEVLNWVINHGTSAAGDFSNTSGNVTINSNAGSFTINAVADNTTEGSETFTVTVSKTLGGVLRSDTTGTITINDTSQTPAVPSINSITASPNPVVEGNSVTWTVSTTNIPNGTVLDWQTNNASDTDPDFGTVTINSNTGTFTYTAVADGITEGNENVTVLVYGTVSGTALSVTSSTLTIQDPAPPATPSVDSVTGPTSVNEGASAVISVSTSNIPNGTSLNWTVNHGTSAAGDFSSTSGTVTINSNSGSFSVATVADSTTEGSETFTVTVSGTVSGTAVSGTTSNITINDTSTTPAVPAINSVNGPASVNEGSGATISVVTSNIPNGTTLNWTILDNPGDFGTSSGTTTVNSNAASFTVTPTADNTTEGSETFRVQVTWTVPNGGSGETATSGNITINDTSVTPLSPVINSVSGPANVDEGSAATINVTTTDIADGTSLSWSILDNPGDFGTSSGTTTVNSNAASFTVTPTADSTTEGSETFRVQVSGGGASAVTSSNITINDTSTSPGFTVGSLSIPSGWDTQRIETLAGAFTEAFCNVNFYHESSNNRIRCSFRHGGTNTTAVINDIYAPYQNLNNITSIQVQYNASSQSCTGACYVGAFGPTPVTDGYNSGTYYTIPTSPSATNIGWMAKANPNTGNDTSVGGQLTSTNSFILRIVDSVQGTFTCAINGGAVIFLEGKLGSTPEF